MRRIFLHIFLAAVNFIIGYLISGTSGNLLDAVAFALSVFGPLVLISSIGISLHYIKVAVLTLLIWAPIAVITLNAITTPYESCVLYVPQAPYLSNMTGGEWLPPSTGAIDFSATNDCLCSGERVNPAAHNSIWAGVLDRKAVSKPAPHLPPALRSSDIQSTVAVSVLVDEAGKVVWAESLSGHPSLRQAAKEAACRARFAPTLVDGPPVRVSGILTYSFGPR